MSRRNSRRFTAPAGAIDAAPRGGGRTAMRALCIAALCCGVISLRGLSGGPAIAPVAARENGPSAAGAAAKPATVRADILPLSAVRVGMKGYGLTVFRGTQPERFDVHVIGVLKKFQPSLDVILIHCDDPRLLHSGIAAGMSGSPIYLEGKLAGALAYGWSFAKDPIAGVTPIEQMLAELDRPSRPSAWTPGPPVAAATVSPGSHGAAVGEPRLQQVAVPLSVAGLGSRAMEDLRQALSPWGLTPLQAGGAADAGRPSPSAFEPGGAIAVQLARGDISMNGTGTVTYVEGDRVLAFGHPMFSAGDVRLPVATAEIVTFLPSQSMSFKMSMALQEKGALLQDRLPCIVADTGQRATMMPLSIDVQGITPGAEQVAALQPHKTFRVELAQHRALTPLLAATVTNNAIQSFLPDVTDAVVEIGTRIDVRGFAPLAGSDYMAAPEGVSNKMIITSTGMRQLQDLMANPFAPVVVDRMDVRVRVRFRSDVAEIVGAALSGDEVEPDTRPNLYVTLRPFSGPPSVQAIPIEIPRWLAGQALKIEVQAGHQVKPEQAPPENLNDFVENLRKGYSARTLVVTLNTAEEGVMLRGRLVPALPASVIATLRPGGASKRGEPYKRVSRQLIDLPTVLSGKQEFTVFVRDEVR